MPASRLLAAIRIGDDAVIHVHAGLVVVVVYASIFVNLLETQRALAAMAFVQVGADVFNIPALRVWLRTVEG